MKNITVVIQNINQTGVLSVRALVTAVTNVNLSEVVTGPPGPPGIQGPAGSGGSGGSGFALTPTSTIPGDTNYTAAPNELVYVDSNTGVSQLTGVFLPTTPNDNTLVGIKNLSSYPIVWTCLVSPGGTATFHDGFLGAGYYSGLIEVQPTQLKVFQYKSATNMWHTVRLNNITKRIR